MVFFKLGWDTVESSMYMVEHELDFLNNPFSLLGSLKEDNKLLKYVYWKSKNRFFTILSCPKSSLQTDNVRMYLENQGFSKIPPKNFDRFLHQASWQVDDK